MDRFILGMLMAVTLTACGGSGPEQASEGPTSTPAIPTATSTPALLTQDEYSERARRMVKHLVYVAETVRATCGIRNERANEILDTDPRVQLKVKEFAELERAMEDLRESEGIVIPEGFDVTVDRLPDSDYAKIASLATKFILAGEALSEAWAGAYRDAGCKLKSADEI